MRIVLSGVLLAALAGSEVQAITGADIMVVSQFSNDSGRCSTSTIGFMYTGTGATNDGGNLDQSVVRLLDGNNNIIASEGFAVTVGALLDSQVSLPIGSTARSNDSVVPPQALPFTIQLIESTSSSQPASANGPVLAQQTFDPLASPTFLVSCGAKLQVTPAGGLSGSGPPGGPFSPSSRTYTATNIGLLEFDFSASGDQTFFDVAPSGGTLGAGASTSVTVSFNTTAEGLGVGTYAGSASFTNDATGNGDTSRSVSLVVEEADLSITKTDNQTLVAPGGALTYEIVASNAGPSAVAAVSVSDAFPPELTCSWTSASQNGATGNTASSGPSLNDTLSMPANSSVTYTVSCDVSSVATGLLSNTATIGSAVADPAPGNNMATDETMVDPTAELSITKTDGTTSAIPGESVVYMIVASNGGPSDAAAVSVSDSFPASLDCSWTSTADLGATGNTSSSGPSLGDTLSMPSGSSVTYTVTCAIAPSATGTLSNTATIGSSLTDPVSANNSATDDDTVLTPTVDLTLAKDDGQTVVNPGDQVSYVITVSQSGPSDAVGISVTDTFPAMLTGVTWSCSATAGSSCTASGTGDLADTASVLAGGTLTYVATGMVGPFAGLLTNTATAMAGAGTAEADLTDNSASDTTTVVSPAQVSATKTVAGSFEPGGGVTYTIVLSNASSSPQLDDPASDEFTDVLPSTLSLLGASADSGVATTAGNTVTWKGVIPAGGSVVITIDAQTVVSSGDVSNQGEVFFDSDGDGTNDTLALTDDPRLPGPEDPTVFVAVPIPAVGLFALGLLVLLTGAVSCWILRR